MNVVGAMVGAALALGTAAAVAEEFRISQDQFYQAELSQSVQPMFSSVQGQSFDDTVVTQALQNVQKRKFVSINYVGISSAGRNGTHGRDGYPGSSGFDGNNAYGMHQRGGNGRDGSDGGHAYDATDGEHARDLYLHLSGMDDRAVQVTGSVNLSLDLSTDRSSCVLVDARGGNGGHGACGGHGGKGGRGGRGHDGKSGRDGSHGTQNRPDGQDGERGENGSDGGDGGRGGSGGNGSNGGSGGNGGRVVIASPNPHLLMLMHPLVGGGTAGAGGEGGDAGRGGEGGEGGRGGHGGSGGHGYHGNESHGRSGNRGMDGSHGRRGHKGQDGRKGHHGRDGRNGINGFAMYQVIDPNTGQIFEQSPTLFNAKIASYEVRAVDDDGILEPGEEVYITNIQIVNTGGLTLPQGTILSFPSTDTFMSANTQLGLPYIHPGNSLLITEKFYGKILDFPSASVPGLYKSNLNIVSSITCLGRQFSEAEVRVCLEVQYPIQIKALYCPSQMGKGESMTLGFEILNLSNRDYGSLTGCGNVSYRVNIDPNMRMIEDETQFVKEGHINQLLAHTSAMSEFSIYIADSAAFFSKAQWNCHVFYKEKCIQIQIALIRVSPNFYPLDQFGAELDCLFVTNHHITQQEFELYIRIFRGLGLRPNFWDCERYKGVSLDASTNQQHPVSWKDGIGMKGKLIFMPLFAEQDLQALIPLDILQHFTNFNPQKQVSSMQSHQHFDSGLVTVGAPTSYDAVVSALFSPVMEYPIDESSLSDKYLIASPCVADLTNLCIKFLGKMHKAHTKNLFVLGNQQFMPRKTKLLTYALGNAFYKTLPVHRVDKFLNVKKRESSPIYVSVDFQELGFNGLVEKIIPIESRFFNVFVALMRASSLQCKLMRYLLQTKPCLAVEEQWRFVGTSNRQAGLTFFDVLRAELCYELLNDFKLDDGCSKLHEMVEIVEKNATLFGENANAMYTILYVLYRLKKHQGAAALNLFNKKLQKKLKLLKNCTGQIEKVFSQFSTMAERKKQAEKDAANAGFEYKNIDHVFKKAHGHYKEKGGLFASTAEVDD